MVVRMALLSSSDQWNFWQQSMRGEINWHLTWVVLTCLSSDWRDVTLQTASCYQISLEHHARLFAVSVGWGSTRIEDLITLLRKTLVLVRVSFWRPWDIIYDMYLPVSACSLLLSFF